MVAIRECRCAKAFALTAFEDGHSDGGVQKWDVDFVKELILNEVSMHVEFLMLDPGKLCCFGFGDTLMVCHCSGWCVPTYSPESALLNEITFCFVGCLSLVILRSGPCDPEEGVNYLHEDSFIPEVVA